MSISGITLGGTDASNYQANAFVTTTASITPKSLVITANPDVKPVDGIPHGAAIALPAKALFAATAPHQ